MISLITERRDLLLKKTYEELLKIPDHKEEKLIFRGRNITVITWKERVGVNAIRVVIQAYRKFFLGIGLMSAIGFEMSDSGEVRHLSKSDIYEYT